MQLNVLNISLLAAVGINGFLAYFTWKRRSIHAGFELLILLIAICWWSFFSFLESLAATVFYKFLFSAMTYAAIVTVPVVFLLFICRYLKIEKFLTVRNISLLFILPAATFIIAVTNNIHGLLWSEIKLAQNPYVGIYALYSRGPWFWVNLIYSYILILIALIILLLFMQKTAKLYRLQARMVIIATIFPFIANMLYAISPDALNYIEITPVFFTFSAIFLFFAIFYYRLFDISPIALNTIIKNLDVGVIIFDDKDNIIDINNSFINIFGIKEAKRGVKKEQLFKKNPHLQQFCNPSLKNQKSEISIDKNNEKRYIQLDCSLLFSNSNKDAIGHIVLAMDITKDKLMEQKIKESEEKFRTLFQNSIDGIYIATPEGKYVDVNNSLVKILGYENREDLVSLDIEKDLYASENERLDFNQRDRLFETRLKKKDGSIIYTEISSKVVYEDNKPKYYQGIVRDITERKKKAKELRDLTEEHEKIFNSTQDAMFLIKVEEKDTFRYIRNNLSHAKLTGITTSYIRDKTPDQLLGKRLGQKIASNYKKCIQAGSPISYEETLKLSGVKRIWYTTLTPVFHGDKPAYIVGSSHDITERKKSEEKIRYLSFHDSLTGLYNRTYFEEEIKRINSDINRFIPVSIISFDMNNLKEVNDKQGHRQGDILISETAKVLSSVIRRTDILARIGGDEFCAILTNTSLKIAKNRKKKLMEKIEEYNNTNEKTNISVAIGIASTLKDEDITEIINQADKDMYENKKIIKAKTGY